MADPSEKTEQDEIEQLLRQQGSAAVPPASAPGPGGQKPKAASAPAAGVSQDDIELLLRKAEQALASIDEPADGLPAGIKTFSFADFQGAAANTESATIELMRDVELDLTIELGRTHMHLEDVLKLK